MKTLLLWYTALATALSTGRVWGQTTPTNLSIGTLRISAQVRSLRQFYWVRELPPHDENPGGGRLGYFGSETPLTLLWRNGNGIVSRVQCLHPNTWFIEPAESPADSMNKARMGSTIQLEIE